MMHEDPRRPVSYILHHCNMGVTWDALRSRIIFFNPNSLANSVFYAKTSIQGFILKIIPSQWCILILKFQVKGLFFHTKP